MERSYLEKFCSTLENRVSLATPWSEGDSTYACDGRVIIRVPRLPDVPERTDAPKNSDKNLFSGLPYELPFLAVPTPEAADYIHCLSCKGSGECTCKDCDAAHSCGKCKGEGVVLSRTNVGTHAFNTRTLRLISQLPNSEWQVKADETRVYFKFEGGDGIITGSLLKDERN